MASPRPLSFFNLPQELRDQIYTKAIVKAHPIPVFNMNPSAPRPQRQPVLYPSCFEVCRRMHEEAARIFYGSNQFDFVGTKDFVRDAWAALVAWIEVIGPLNTSHMKKIGMTFPEVRKLVLTSRDIPVPRHIMRLYTTRFDDNSFWQMDDMAKKACKLLLDSGVKLQSFQWYFSYFGIDVDELSEKLSWGVEEVRNKLALAREQMIFEYDTRLLGEPPALGYTFVATR
ncbi:MAG: hypothetical protein LQ347_005938 [Umbilicaria vellea]|nr:MAG: hypothetical protein LQ347_005938 [Umbilicaria vellea]